MALEWAWTFNANVAVADLVARGWQSTAPADTLTNVTDVGALSAPANGDPGDTHVLTCESGAGLATPLYLGIGTAGDIDQGCFCARVKWVTGDAVALASAPLLTIEDDAGNELFVLHAATSGGQTALRTAQTTAVITGNRQLAAGDVVNVAIVYDYSIGTPTIAVYLDGVLDISATDGAAATVGRIRLGSHGGEIAYNTLRYYGSTADSSKALITNAWMQILPPAAVTATGWSQVGSPSSDLDAIEANDLTTGLERSTAGTLDVSAFDDPTYADTAALAMGVVVMGTMVDLAVDIDVEDGAGSAATFDDETTSGAMIALALTTTDSGAAALTQADVDDLNSTIGVGVPQLAPAAELWDSATYSGMTVLGVWALRRRVSTYTGAGVRVRDATGTEEDLSFDAFGDLDSPTGLPPFTVRTIYDQSGNGEDLEQSTASLQPTLEPTGTAGGKPRIVFTAANTEYLETAGFLGSSGNALLDASPSVWWSGEHDGATNGWYGALYDSTARYGIGFGSGTDLQLYGNGGTDTATWSDPGNTNDAIAYIGEHNSTHAHCYQETDSNIPVDTTGAATTYTGGNTHRFRVGYDGGSYLTCAIYEVSVLSGVATESERIAAFATLTGYWR